MATARQRHRWGLVPGPAEGPKVPRAAAFVATAESGRRVYYGTLADLITWFEEAPDLVRLVPSVPSAQFHPAKTCNFIRC